MRITSVVRELACLLTTDEKVQYSSEIARAIEDKRAAETRLKTHAAQIKSEISLADQQINRLSTIISSGCEYRQIECKVVYEFSRGKKEYFRVDTGALAGDDWITESERQEQLNLESGEEEGPVAIPAGEKIEDGEPVEQVGESALSHPLGETETRSRKSRKAKAE